MEREGKYALEKRSDKGLLASLYEFPFFEGEADVGRFGEILKKKKAKHIFTHIEWRMTGYLIKARGIFPQYEWRTAEEIKNDYAIPSAFKAFTEWLQ